MLRPTQWISATVLYLFFANPAFASLPICDPLCRPDPTSSTYAGALAARPKILNARGHSSPIVARAALDAKVQNSGDLVVGSQSYNYVIPMLRLPGRAGMDLTLNLYYNSRIWNIDNVNMTATFNIDRDFPSYGFRLDFGYIEIGGSQVVLTQGDGTKIALTLSGTANTYYATDGTGIQYNLLQGILLYKNGVLVLYEPFPSSSSFLRPNRIVDSNGNYISITYVSGFDQLISTITDTLGHVITFNYDSSSHLVSLSQALHPSGTKTVATFTWGNPYASGYAWYNFSGLTVNGAPTADQISVLTGCTYPNGTGYRFTYGDWGIIDKIETLSAGANPSTRSYRSYNYPLASAGALTDAPAYTQQTVSPDGTTTNTSPWTYKVTKSGTGVVTSMEIDDPNGNSRITSLNATTGLISSLQVKDSSGALQRQFDYTWTTTVSSGGVPSSNVLDNVVTTLSDSGQQSKIAYAYDSFANRTDVYEYDFGLTLKRHTITSYLTTGFYNQVGTTYIVNRPTKILVEDGGGAIAARTDLAYDNYTGNPLTSVTGAANHSDRPFDSSYTVRGNVTSVTRYSNASAGSGGVTRTFSYDTVGNVRVAQLDCCNQKTFNFSSTTQWSFPDSIVRGPTGGTQFTTSFTYDRDTGSILSTTDENSQVTQYQYDSMPRLTQVTLPPQNGTNVHLNTLFNDTAASATVTAYNTANNAEAVTTLDGLGHVMQVDNIDCPATSPGCATVISSVKYAYDKLWQRTQASNPYAPGDTIVNTTFNYDSLGRVTQVTPPSSGFTQNQYSGNTVTITDPAGHPRKNFTDALGHLVEVDEPGGGSPATASSGSLTINGTLNSSISSGQSATAGHVELTFSGTLQSKTSCSPSGQPCTDSGTITITVGSFTKSAAYSSSTGTNSGQTVQALANAFSSDKKSPVDGIFYGADEFGNIVMDLVARTTGAATNYPLSVKIVSNNPANFSPPSFQVSAGSSLIGGQDAAPAGSTVYDSGTVYVNIGGNTFFASAPYSHTGNNTAAMIASALVAPGPTSLNQPSSPVTASSSGSTITLTYKAPGAAGNVFVGISSSTANPDNPSFTSPGTTLSNGADAVPPTLSTPSVTLYAYDVLDNLLSVTHGSQTRSYAYDSLSHVTSVTTPESGTVTTFYTNSSGGACAGNPALPCRVQDARGIVKTVSYDAVNRLSGVSYSDGTTPTMAYQYDAGGSSAFALDRLTKITEGSNSQTFTYDNFGRITAVSQMIDGTTYSLQYAYNLAGQLTSITYPTGRVVSQNVDEIARLSSIGDATKSYLSNLSYNAAGATLGFTLGNQVQSAFTYNDHLQLATLRFFKSGAASDVLNLSYDYTSGVPGNNGQIQAVHYDTSPGVEDKTKSEQFTYDPLGRLSAAQTVTVNSTAGSGTWSLQWTYDGFGNRTGQNVINGDPNLTIPQPNLQIDPSTNRVVGYCYDAAGNLLDQATCPTGGHTYTYDGANRLTQINGGSASYTYFGPLRIKKASSGTTTVYIYAGSKPIVEYVNGTVSKEYIYAGSQLLATLAGSTTTYHHPDHLSNRADTDASGNVSRTFGHFPFGEAWYETGTSDKWKFTSYERDSGTGETGLDYAQFRYYSSGLGRFMSADLKSGDRLSPQSLNRYAYVSNDPVNVVDPHGLSAEGGDEPLRCFVDNTLFFGTFCELLFDSLFGGGGSEDNERGGGGGAGTRQDKEPQAEVNLTALVQCLAELFSVMLESFEQSKPGEPSGSFTGIGPDIREPNNGFGEFTVVNSSTLYTLADINEMTPNAPGLVTGFTYSNLSKAGTNYTALDVDSATMLSTQIWELGNSLALIGGQITPGTPIPVESEPGLDLFNCYKQANGGHI